MRVRWVLAGVVVVVTAVGLWAFEPWRLWTSSTVDEDLPTVADGVVLDADRAPAGGGRTERHRRDRGPGTAPATEPPEPDLVDLATGDFEDAEHGTTGRARLLRLADGSRYVRLEDLSSSDGPDLHVWLSDQPSGGAWGSYDDGDHVALGELKATHGNQNYEVPAGADVADMRSVVIWCDRFNVAFGTAPLTPAG